MKPYFRRRNTIGSVSVALQRELVVLAFICLVAPARAPGQASLTSPLPGLDSIAFARLQGLVSTQRTIRVSVSREEGILYGPRLSYTALMSDSSSRTQWPPALSLSAVRAIAVPRSRAAEFALEGAVTGVALGFIGGLVSRVHFSLISGWRTEGDAADVAQITVVSAAVGAGLGAMIGALAREWNVVYATP